MSTVFLESPQMSSEIHVVDVHKLSQNDDMGKNEKSEISDGRVSQRVNLPAHLWAKLVKLAGRYSAKPKTGLLISRVMEWYATQPIWVQRWAWENVNIPPEAEAMMTDTLKRFESGNINSSDATTGKEKLSDLDDRLQTELPKARPAKRDKPGARRDSDADAA
jgi:hypothetical protein